MTPKEKKKARATYNRMLRELSNKVDQIASNNDAIARRMFLGGYEKPRTEYDDLMTIQEGLKLRDRYQEQINTLIFWAALLGIHEDK